ncbi:MAG: hypothetical protein AAGE84_03785 [Cyanobacteria bacterium P01_G01_bin.39]
MELLGNLGFLGNFIVSSNIPHAGKLDREVWNEKDRSIKGTNFCTNTPKW